MRFLVGLIGGAGTMGTSFASCLVHTGFPPQHIMASGRDVQKLNRLASVLGIQVGTNSQTAKHANALILAVKPQVAEAVCKEIKEEIQEKKPLVISVVTATPTEEIADWLECPKASIVRAMPNTAIAVEHGVTAIYPNAHVTEAQKAMTEEIFARTGTFHWVDSEVTLTRLTPLIGCGPAYVNLLEEAMVHAAITQGIPRYVAEIITINVIQGATILAQQSGSSAQERRQQVTTPHGVTAAAMGVLCPEQFCSQFVDAFKAAESRCQQIEEELHKKSSEQPEKTCETQIADSAPEEGLGTACRM